MTQTKHLILASGSPARAKVLRDARLGFEVKVAKVDEDAILAQIQEKPFPEQVAALAEAKAQSVAQALLAKGAHLGDATYLVLGCDSMFEFGGRLQGKPYLWKRALDNILEYRTRSGTLHTGHALCEVRSGTLQTLAQTVSTAVHFGDYTEEEAMAYVATDEPLEVAGSFAIDARGAAFIERIDGDYQSVVGVSVYALQKMLRDFGHSITDFWVEA